MIILLNGGSPDKLFYEDLRPNVYLSKSMDGIGTIRKYMNDNNLDLLGDYLVSANEEDLQYLAINEIDYDCIIIPKDKNFIPISPGWMDKKIQISSFNEYAKEEDLFVTLEIFDYPNGGPIVFRPYVGAGSRGLRVFCENSVVESPYVIRTQNQKRIEAIVSADGGEGFYQEYGPEEFLPMNVEMTIHDGKVQSSVTHAKDFHERYTRWTNGAVVSTEQTRKVNEIIGSWITDVVGVHTGMVNFEYHMCPETGKFFFIECNWRNGSTMSIPYKLFGRDLLLDYIKLYEGKSDHIDPLFIGDYWVEYKITESLHFR